ncbi:hypothetical protein [Deinococcus radiophilus]
MPDFSFQTFDVVDDLSTLQLFDAPAVWANFAHQAQNVMFEAVDANGKAHTIAEYPFVGRTGSNTYTFGSTSRPWDSFVWDGTLEDGSEAPAGQYTLRLRVLKALGNPDNANHWETYTSPAFRVMRDASGN